LPCYSYFSLHRLNSYTLIIFVRRTYFLRVFGVICKEWLFHHVFLLEVLLYVELAVSARGRNVCI